jgi:hypothetical protein
MPAEVLPRHTITGPLLWPWLVRLLAGLSLKAAAEQLRLPFALETVYRLYRRLRRGLARLRTVLCSAVSPPPSCQSDPLLQTVEHLQAAFPADACPLAAFQLRFQQPWLG